MLSKSGDRIPEVLDPRDERPAIRSVLGDWLTFQQALALKPQKAVELIRRYGGPRSALSAYSNSPGLSGPGRRAAIEALCRANAAALPILSPAYPERLAVLADPPPLLLVRGDVGVLSGQAVAVVGARAATSYGKRVARRLAVDLAEQGLVIVSGLARGIDAEAHLGALEAGGRTVAVQACGPDRVYPREHSSLADRIAACGAVVSELPLGTAPLPAFFPLRNLLISGLASSVVVVEARERSGSLITAFPAANQGRDVFAVPGPITAPTSVGTNRLLRDGAYVALGSDDILGVLGFPRQLRAAKRSAAESSPTLRAILRALAQAPASRDELGRRLSCTPEQLTLDLVELELEGRIAEDRDGRLKLLDLPA